MIGDKLVLTEVHRQNARRIFAALEQLADAPQIVSVSGESGAGKSETAKALQELAEAKGLRTFVFAQDDYFHLPPATNAARRKEDPNWRGPKEVRLDLLNEHLLAARRGPKTLSKPLVFFAEDRIGEETVSLNGVDLIIVEGTYTAMLDAVDLRAFLSGDYKETLAHRKARARDETEGEWIEQVLHAEHEVISKHRSLADVIL